MGEDPPCQQSAALGEGPSEEANEVHVQNLLRGTWFPSGRLPTPAHGGAVDHKMSRIMRDICVKYDVPYSPQDGPGRNTLSRSPTEDDPAAVTDEGFLPHVAPRELSKRTGPSRTGDNSVVSAGKLLSGEALDLWLTAVRHNVRYLSHCVHCGQASFEAAEGEASPLGRAGEIALPVGVLRNRVIAAEGMCQRLRGSADGDADEEVEWDAMAGEVFTDRFSPHSPMEDVLRSSSVSGLVLPPRQQEDTWDNLMTHVDAARRGQRRRYFEVLSEFQELSRKREGWLQSRRHAAATELARVRRLPSVIHALREQASGIQEEYANPVRHRDAMLRQPLSPTQAAQIRADLGQIAETVGRRRALREVEVRRREQRNEFRAEQERLQSYYDERAAFLLHETEHMLQDTFHRQRRRHEDEMQRAREKLDAAERSLASRKKGHTLRCAVWERFRTATTPPSLQAPFVVDLLQRAPYSKKLVSRVRKLLRKVRPARVRNGVLLQQTVPVTVRGPVPRSPYFTESGVSREFWPSATALTTRSPDDTEAASSSGDRESFRDDPELMDQRRQETPHRAPASRTAPQADSPTASASGQLTARSPSSRKSSASLSDAFVAKLEEAVSGNREGESMHHALEAHHHREGVGSRKALTRADNATLTGGSPRTRDPVRSQESGEGRRGHSMRFVGADDDEKERKVRFLLDGKDAQWKDGNEAIRQNPFEMDDTSPVAEGEDLSSMVVAWSDERRKLSPNRRMPSALLGMGD